MYLRTREHHRQFPRPSCESLHHSATNTFCSYQYVGATACCSGDAETGRVQERLTLDLAASG